MLEFKVEEDNFIAEIKDGLFLEPQIQELLKAGAVFSGSFVLSYIHKTSFSDVDIFCSVQNWKNVSDILGKITNLKKIEEPYCDSIIGLRYQCAGECMLEYILDAKLDIFVLDIPHSEIVTNLQNYFDFDRCASRIIFQNGKTLISIPINDEMDPKSKNIRRKNKSKSTKRVEKYIDRGFSFFCCC